jgi:hypothetical protein
VQRWKSKVRTCRIGRVGMRWLEERGEEKTHTQERRRGAPDVKGFFDVSEIAQNERDLAADKDAGGEAIRLASLPESCR